MPTTFEAMAAGYRKLWRAMTVTRVADCDQAARVILAGRERYLAVEEMTGVPWFFIGLLHMRESGNNFAGVLHNGEHIIGTGRKTRLVPAGRGPFSTWEQSAVDAIKLHGLHLIKAWTAERIGYESERFNGWGYVARGINSPYVWAGSNQYTRGKYVADGMFSPSTIDRQLGTMPVLAALCRISPDINDRISGQKPSSAATGVAAGGAGAVVAIGMQHSWSALAWIIAGIGTAIVIGGAIYLIRKYRTTEPADLPPVIDQPGLVAPRAGAAVEHNV